jgi:uncharacterized membrane-anchored protein YhcB (DUF1043 family)
MFIIDTIFWAIVGFLIWIGMEDHWIQAIPHWSYPLIALLLNLTLFLLKRRVESNSFTTEERIIKSIQDSKEELTVNINKIKDAHRDYFY